MASGDQAAGGQAEKFLWEFDSPNTPLWDDAALKAPLPRNFLTCFTAHEISEMNLEASARDFSQDEKLRLLVRRVHDKYKAREAEVTPSHLYETDWEDWQRLLVGIIHLQELSGLASEQEQSVGSRARGWKQNSCWMNIEFWLSIWDRGDSVNTTGRTGRSSTI